MKCKRAIQQFNISRSALNDLRYDENSCDVYLVCEGVKLPAHRLILQAGSKYFATMFTSGFSEESSKEIEFPTILEESMAIILDFIYMNCVCVEYLSVEQTFALLSAAHLIEINPLVEKCVDELIEKIRFENWPMILSIAQTYSINRLITAVVEHMAHLDLTAGKNLLDLDVDSLEVFITKSSNGKCHSSNNLVKVILCWVNHNKSDRKQHLQRLLAPIDFSTVTKNTVTAVTNDEELFTDNLELSHFLLKRVSQPFTPNTIPVNTNPKLLIFKSNSVHSLDLTTRTWSIHNLHESLMPVANTPIAVSDQAVYYTADVSDGRGDFNRESVEMRVVTYDPHLNLGSEITISFKRFQFGMAILNNVLYFVGGRHNSMKESRRFERFDTISKKWQRLSSLILGRQDPVVVTLDGDLYVFGGTQKIRSPLIRDVDKYCPTVDQWTVIITLHCKIDGNITVVPCLDKIYLTMKRSTGRVYSNVFEFNPSDKSWREFDVNGYGNLCGSGKPLQVLFFTKDGAYYQVHPESLKTVFRNNSVNTGEESVVTVIFA